ncbi:class II aldolase/adducin family protein, partial [Mycobacterium rufum]|nr:class II aldolase/adducin family protein [Mycolicibacterium rufum]
VYPRGVLLRNRQLAQEMVAAMGDRPVVILRAHGLTSVAETVERAVIQAISVDTISRLSLQIASAGGALAELTDDDAAELPDLGNALNDTIAWRHELGRLENHRS